MPYWYIRSFCVEDLAYLNIQFHKSKCHMPCAAAYMGEEEVEKNKTKQKESGTQSIHATVMRYEEAMNKTAKSSVLSQYPELYYMILFCILWGGSMKFLIFFYFHQHFIIRY